MLVATEFIPLKNKRINNKSSVGTTYIGSKIKTIIKIWKHKISDETKIALGIEVNSPQPDEGNARTRNG